MHDHAMALNYRESVIGMLSLKSIAAANSLADRLQSPAPPGLNARRSRWRRLVRFHWTIELASLVLAGMALAVELSPFNDFSPLFYAFALMLASFSKRRWFVPSLAALSTLQTVAVWLLRVFLLHDATNLEILTDHLARLMVIGLAAGSSVWIRSLTGERNELQEKARFFGMSLDIFAVGGTNGCLQYINPPEAGCWATPS
jgi:hypothetical protein